MKPVVVYLERAVLFAFICCCRCSTSIGDITFIQLPYLSNKTCRLVRNGMKSDQYTRTLGRPRLEIALLLGDYPCLCTLNTLQLHTVQCVRVSTTWPTMGLILWFSMVHFQFLMALSCFSALFTSIVTFAIQKYCQTVWQYIFFYCRYMFTKLIVHWLLFNSLEHFILFLGFQFSFHC